MSRRVRKRARKKRQKRAILLCIIALVVILAALLIGYFVKKNKVNQVAKDVIWEHISIGGTDVSGLKKKEAEEVLLQTLQEYRRQEVTLVADGVKAKVTLEELGLGMENAEQVIKEAVAFGKTGSVENRYKKWKDLQQNPKDFALQYMLDVKTAETAISQKIPHLDNEAKNATIKRENGVFKVTDGKSGKKIDMEASMSLLSDYIKKEWKQQANGSITLVTTVDEPDIKAEDLKKVKDVLGTFSTSFSAGSNRGKNISHAAAFINGAVLMPGEELSASNAMKSRTKENGYLEAGSYLDGQTVDTYGGGVCQVSSTLYNAVILAELEITERWSHSMSVNYVQPSMDAAISEGYKDLKFKNNTDAPIYIEGYTSGGRLTFTIYGKDSREAGRSITFVSEVTSKTEAKKKFVASGDAVGTLKKSSSGHDAMKAKLWKVVTVNGSEVSREAVNSSSYRSSTATWKVGTATDNAEAKKVLTDAIATQDEAKIQAAITRAKEVIATSAVPETPIPEAPMPTPDVPETSQP